MNPEFAELSAHYLAQDEGTRLTRTPHGRLELIRTREILTRFLPPPPAAVLDVGGGTGVHAAWLAGCGYNVHLIDPMDHHVQQALAHGAVTACVGDARCLSVVSGAVDAVLLLGPLYHLVESRERALALSEAYRVLRPGGILVAAAIGRYMALLTYCADGALDSERMHKLHPTLASGRYDPSLDFTDAYFHRPEELVAELMGSGFSSVRVLGVEGPAWPVADTATGSEAHFCAALTAARALEEDSAVLAVNAHILAIGFKSQRALT